MAIRIEAVTIDAHDPRAQGRWWAEALGWRVTDESDDEVLVEPAEGGPEAGVVPELLFIKVPESKAVKNRIHLDLRPDDQEAEVARFEGLGARRVEIGQAADDRCTWVVLTDPEDNEFCILRTREDTTVTP